MSRPTYAEIDLSAIDKNIKNILNQTRPAAVMAVVKANGYGHGALEVSKQALESGAQYLAVAVPEEGIALRKNSISAPILVFAGLFPDQADVLVKHELEATVYTPEQLQALARAAAKNEKTAVLHIKVDTGMGRVGVPWQNALAFIRKAQNHPHVRIQGLYTHFATSDEKDKTYAYLQLDRFQSVVEECRQAKIKIPVIHTANSGAILDIPESYFDMVRPGVMMYGYYPSPDTTESIEIHPAMTLQTQVLHIKTVPQDTYISYGRLYRTRESTRIATLPIGYADGYNRALTNKAEALIRGTRYPVVGRVCMDLIMVDVGNNNEISVGDPVVLYGQQGSETISIQDVASKLGTIPYEVTCWISNRVPRLYKHYQEDL